MVITEERKRRVWEKGIRERYITKPPVRVSTNWWQSKENIRIIALTLVAMVQA